MGEHGTSERKTLYLQRIGSTIERKVDEFEGIAGVAVLDLITGNRLEVKEGAQFPTASTIKVHLLVALVKLHLDGSIDLDERVEVTDRLAGSPVLGCLDDSMELSWRDLANLMIIVSDNTATNMIIDLVGFGRMAAFLESWGLNDTVLQRKMKDFEAAGRGLDNLSTPLDSVRLLELLWSGSGFSAGVAEECLRILKKPKKSYFRTALPVGTSMANKSGELPGVLCEMAIVYLANRPFAMSVMSSSGPSDQLQHVRWTFDLARTIYESLAAPDERTR
jgi:beta-lactamase class A